MYFKASDSIKKFISGFEGVFLTPYICPAGVPTIGIGATFYENGVRVTMNDKPLKIERVLQLFDFHLGFFERDVNSLIAPVADSLKQCQFDALLSFAFNVGTDIDQDNIPEGLGDSTLLKKVLNNPNDLTIESEFLKWDKSKGVRIKGLTIRRKKEVNIYFNRINFQA